MKKILFSLVAVMVSLTAMAGSDITVQQGDKKFFKTASGNAIIEYIWDGATYDNRMPLTQKFDNLEELKPKAVNAFNEVFNNKCKTVKMVTDASQAKYKFTMKVTKMDQYFKVMGFIPGNATKVWGTFTISDAKTGETLVVIDVAEVDGGANPSPDGSFADCFEDLAKQVSKLK